MATNTQRKSRPDTASRVETARRPDLRAYTVRGEGDSAYWLPVGAAWSHNDGKGLTVRLEALPLDGKLVLRDEEPPTDDV